MNKMKKFNGACIAGITGKLGITTKRSKIICASNVTAVTDVTANTANTNVNNCVLTEEHEIPEHERPEHEIHEIHEIHEKHGIHEMHEIHETQRPPKPEPSFIKVITGKLINLVATEINKKETQVLVREKIIIPVITLIYSELYPYIILLVITITLIFILTFLTFLFFLVFYFKK